MRVAILIIIRLLLFIFSAGTLACHIAQISLLERSHDEFGFSNEWWPGYAVYTLYYVGAGFSFLCALALFVLSFMPSIRSTRGDRILSIICVALLIAVIVYNSLEGGLVPWLGGTGTTPDPQAGIAEQKGFATYCSNYGTDSAESRNIFYRCWLQNGAWLGMIILAALWIVLALYTFLQSRSRIYRDKDEHNYIEDAPMALDHTSSASPGPYPAGTTAVGTPPQQYANLGGQQYDSAAYPSYYNYHDSGPAQYPPPQRQMSYSTDYSGSGAPLYANGGNPGYTFPYGEKVAVATPSEHSMSEPPHSHDGVRV
ncbi:hypothetical protein BJV82DRAFT_615994 [Fennellomyces sp. T-0311]|nr:hypothetical protein BJV82DRAFT_615994 [Fennellomyces sp. T-0311]